MGEDGSAKRFLLDFEIESDGSFADDATVAKIRHPEDVYNLEIRNLSVAPAAELPLLSAHLVITAADHEDAQTKGRDILVGVLQLLTFLTNMGYKIHKLVRVVDWTPGIKERLCLQYAKSERPDTPYAVLTDEIFKSLETLERIRRSDVLQRALRWFSLGVRSRFTDEQFQFFWFVIELLAQVDKRSVEVHDTCPRCEQPLYCSTCEEHPMHWPYPKQLIQALMLRIAPEYPTFFPTMNKIRNLLSHGESAENVEASLKLSLADEVNKLGRVAWIALYQAFMAAFPDKSRPANIHTVETNEYVRRTLGIGAHILFRSRDPENPSIDDVPKINLTIKTRDRSSPPLKHS